MAAGAHGGSEYLSAFAPQLEAGSRAVDGRGVFAKERLAAGSAVVEVPEERLLNIYTALADPAFRDSAKVFLDSGVHHDTVLLLFFLWRHRSAKNEAPLTPEGFLRHVAGLTEQTEFSHLTTMPPEAIEAMGSDQVKVQAEEAVGEVWRMLREVTQIMADNAMKLFPDNSLTFDALLWAKCVFDSRAFSVVFPPKDGERHGADTFKVKVGDSFLTFPERVTSLVPVADFLNHSFHAQCAVPRFDAEKRVFQIHSLADIDAGAQVFLNYGALQSWEFLHYYGFLVAENPFDVLNIGFDEPTEPEKLVRLALSDVTTDHCIRLQGGLSEKLMECLRICLKEPEQSEEDLETACLDTIEHVLSGFADASKSVTTSSTEWWRSDFGDLVDRFRASQQKLLDVNLAHVAKRRAAHKRRKLEESPVLKN